MGALDIYSDHRDYQIEDGPFSETFVLDPEGAATEIRGIYDEPYVTQERDSGKVRQQMLAPRVLLSQIPSSIIPRTTKIQVRDHVYVINKVDRDSEGVPRLWLG